jgi:hypothetical protein
MAKLSEEKIAENMTMVQKMVVKWPKERARLVAKMLTTPSIVGEEFFMAPASVKEEYHNCFPGGLCDHSLRVVDNLKKLANSLAGGRYTIDQLEFVGLFHDLGKVGDGSNPYYLPNPDDWQRSKRGILYITNKDCAYMPTSERGLFVLQKYGIELNAEEYLAIRLNDGQYDDTNKNYKMKEPDLALLVHFADRWATSQEKSNL